VFPLREKNSVVVPAIADDNSILSPLIENVPLNEIPFCVMVKLFPVNVIVVLLAVV
jgi:hypothetical protein